MFYCEKCKRVSRSQLLAEQCCQNYTCSKCGKDVGNRSWLVCEDCRLADSLAKEKARFAKAEKLTEWDGWVYCEGLDGSDDFHASVSDMLDVVEQPPEYVWACKPRKLVDGLYDSLLRGIEEQEGVYDGFEADSLNGLDELKAALLKFEQANEQAVSYSPDYSKAVLIPKGNQ